PFRQISTTQLHSGVELGCGEWTALYHNGWRLAPGPAYGAQAQEEGDAAESDLHRAAWRIRVGRSAGCRTVLSVASFQRHHRHLLKNAVRVRRRWRSIVQLQVAEAVRCTELSASDQRTRCPARSTERARR